MTVTEYRYHFGPQQLVKNVGSCRLFQFGAIGDEVRQFCLLTENIQSPVSLIIAGIKQETLSLLTVTSSFSTPQLAQKLS